MSAEPKIASTGHSAFPTEAGQPSAAESSYRIVRTLRVRNDNRPGVLGEVATAIGRAGGNLGDIRTVERGSRNVVRDMDVSTTDLAMLELVLAAIREIPDTHLLDVRDEVLRVHLGGKLQIKPRYPVRSVADLRHVYTPGVAEVCRLIEGDPSVADRYTGIANSVAVVTDGTAVLGLGNIGPVAGMPVIEGKCALMAQMVGIDAYPLLVRPGPSDSIVDALVRISPTFGAIQLEDFAAPHCFEITPALQERVDIPVMHDDQHGTATVVLAAVLRGATMTGQSLQDLTAGVVGLGAAGSAIAQLLMHHQGKAVLGTGRTPDSLDRLREGGGIAVELDELMARCDVVIAATAQPGLLRPDQIRPGQIIFAISNPLPEIEPERAMAAGAALAVDGAVVNNLLGFPGLYRGALDTRARRFNTEMYVAAALAIASRARDGEVVPDSLDREVHMAVAKAVARAAIETGVARTEPSPDYFEATSSRQP
ncbi:MAG: ACT domain-containing protein [Candidatus Dormibacteraeota bacterium]|jgi:malate dehydrogenase (oxaloacetate-decarboxylating)|nr:ACT domain-containing protein [Candidatus Dormibacteraeota bacterium]